MSKKVFWKDKNIRGSIVCGIGVGIVFIILRLVNITSWSWWAVTSPLWGTVTSWILAGIVHALLGRKDSNVVSAFAGLSGIINLFVIFCVLRLLSVIDWSWWVIAIPLWVGGGLMIVTGLGFAAHRAYQQKESA